MDSSTTRNAAFEDVEPSLDDASRESDALTGYRRRRLELAEIVRAAMNLASQRRDEERREQARDLLARLAEDRFELAVVGQFSRGKSTLMNAILGHPYLPTGALPMTSVVTSVRYGTNPRALVHRRGIGLPAETSLQDLVRFVAQSSVEREELEVVSADVEVPAELLRLGFHFVDTPGIGSAIAANTATTKRFLPDADAVIFVTSFDAPLSEPELEFFDEVRSHVDKLFLVVNKIDLVSAAEADDVVSFVRAHLGEHSGGEPRIFAVSARDGLQAKLSASSERLAASGLPELERSLVQFLATDKSRSFLLRTCDRTARLLARQRLDLELGTRTATAAAARNKFDQRVAGIKAEQQESIERLLQQIDAEFPGWLSERSRTWSEELRTRVLPRAAEAKAPLSDDPNSGLSAGLAAVVEEWFRRRLSEVRSVLVNLAAGELTELHSATSSVERVAAEIFDIPLPELEVDALWSPADLPALTVRAPTFRMSFEARRRYAVRRADQPEQRIREALDHAVSRYVDDVRAAFDQAARAWVRAVADSFDSATGKSAQRIRTNLAARADDSEIATLEKIELRLAGLRSDVETWTPPASEAPPPATRPHTFVVRCAICEQVAGLPFDYMAHAQWELQRQPERLAEHTQLGGFCPLHAWQFAEVASDLGIALAYSELARSAAELLRSSNHSSRREAELATAAARLVVKPDRCPACAALATAELDSVRELVAALPEEPQGEPAPPLCVPHLAAVLATHPGAERARWLTERLAATLARMSEDMRTFALKRESVRRQLLSEEELAAPLQAISYLAGSRELARPWHRDDRMA